MTTTEEKLTLAREALEKIAPRMPGSIMAGIANAALAAIATESAPAAGAASIDTEKLAEEFGLWSEQREKFVAHVAQQHEAGLQEGAEDLANERRLLREGIATVGEQHRRIQELEAQLAARAVGGEHNDPTHPNHPGHHDGMTCERAAQVIVDLIESQYPGSSVKFKDVIAQAVHATEATPVVSAQAPVVAAPVGDGDERADTCMAIAHRWAQAAYCKALNRGGEDIDAIKAELRAALTQQKGG